MPLANGECQQAIEDEDGIRQHGVRGWTVVVEACSQAWKGLSDGSRPSGTHPGRIKVVLELLILLRVPESRQQIEGRGSMSGAVFRGR